VIELTNSPTHQFTNSPIQQLWGGLARRAACELR
jgi:hypothetical protein